MPLTSPRRSFSNGNAPPSPATLTMFGVHLGAGDNHWAKLA